jgi:hypothetical protein
LISVPLNLSRSNRDQQFAYADVASRSPSFLNRNHHHPHQALGRRHDDDPFVSIGALASHTPPISNISGP